MAQCIQQEKLKYIWDRVAVMPVQQPQPIHQGMCKMEVQAEICYRNLLGHTLMIVLTTNRQVKGGP